MALHDREIREPLFEYLEETHGRIRILEEIGIGDSRADVVMVEEDALVGIEIKSDADSYIRLKSQVWDYNRYFDYNVIAVGSTHAMHAADHVPDWWGILSVEKEPDGFWDFYWVRKCGRNPDPGVLEKKLSLLWKEELGRIQRALDMPKYAGKSRAFIASKIAARSFEETDEEAAGPGYDGKDSMLEADFKDTDRETSESVLTRKGGVLTAEAGSQRAGSQRSDCRRTGSPGRPSGASGRTAEKIFDREYISRMISEELLQRDYTQMPSLRGKGRSPASGPDHKRRSGGRNRCRKRNRRR